MKIVEVSTLVPGPMATELLVKHAGANVVKFEDKSWGDGLMAIPEAYKMLNKDKTIVSVDFRGEGIEKIKKEVSGAQVFVESFRAGRADRLGLGYEDMKAVNSEIIYVAIKGYPAGHKWAKRAAHDINILAVTGYLQMQPGLVPPILMADMFTAYHTALRILGAWIKKEKEVSVAMSEAMGEALSGAAVGRFANPLTGEYPCYGVYKVRDGWVAVGALEKPLWVDVCDFLKREDLVNKQFDREARGEVADALAKHEKSDFEETDFCVTPVLDLNEAKKYGFI